MERKEKENIKIFRKLSGKFVFVLFLAAVFVTFNFNLSDCGNGSIFASAQAFNFVESINLLLNPAGHLATEIVAKEGGEFLLGKGGDALKWVVNWILYSLLVVLSWFLGAAGILFDWAIKPGSMTAVLERPVIYEMWSVVRDTLNLLFILVLLFSAFCTVFQVEKYHWKKILTILVIMALLINFSFPIARFVVDVSNIAMYFFIESAFPEITANQSLSVRFAYFSNIDDILVPSGTSVGDMSTVYLIIANIFTFIFMITILVIAVMFVIRITALAILIIFSPVGFIGILPGKIEGYANDWWKNLFKYALFGPIMVFMLLISYKMMEALGAEQQAISAAEQIQALSIQSTTDVGSGTFLGNIAYFVIPVVLLWMGLMAALNSSIAGSKFVKGYADKAIGWGKRFGMGTVKYPFVGTGLAGGVKGGWQDFKKTGRLFGGKVPLAGSAGREAREERLAGLLTGGIEGYKGAEEMHMKKLAEDYKKTKSLGDLRLMARGGDAAAAYALADTKDIEQEDYDGVISKNRNPKVKKALDSKVKQNRADIVAINKSHNKLEMDNVRKNVKEAENWDDKQVSKYIVENEMKKMNADKWTSQDWDDVESSLPKMSEQDRDNLKNAIKNAFGGLDKGARPDVRKKMSAKNLAVLAEIMGKDNLLL